MRFTLFDEVVLTAYNYLCDAVKPLPGLNGPAGDKPDWDLYPTLTYSPDLGRRHWSMA